MPVSVKCKHCNSSFMSPIRKGVTYLYCSRPCYWAANTGPRPDLVKLSPVKCPQCLKEFQPKDASKRFCSRGCAGSYRWNADQRGQGPTRTVKCLTCGEMFKRSSRKNTYCSPRCFTSVNIRERNNKFNNFICDDPRGYKRLSDSHPEHPGRYLHHVIWRSANPDAACADCRGNVQHVHHEDGNKGNNDLSNLTGLCASCHARRHAIENGLGRHVRG